MRKKEILQKIANWMMGGGVDGSINELNNNLKKIHPSFRESIRKLWQNHQHAYDLGTDNSTLKTFDNLSNKFTQALKASGKMKWK